MLKTIFAAATLIAATATPALADEAHTFTRDGETYAYTQTVKADRTEIDGRVLSSGSTFHLTVHGSRVTGIASGIPVSFVMPKPGAAVSSTEVASR